MCKGCLFVWILLKPVIPFDKKKTQLILFGTFIDLLQNVCIIANKSLNSLVRNYWKILNNCLIITMQPFLFGLLSNNHGLKHLIRFAVICYTINKFQLLHCFARFRYYRFLGFKRGKCLFQYIEESYCIFFLPEHF